MPRFIAREDGDYHNCSFSYSAELVAFIKGSVPRRMRWWDPDNRYWTIHSDHLPRVLEEARYQGFTVNVIHAASHTDDPPPHSRAMPGSGDATSDFAHLLSYDALHRAYKCAAMEFHPDRPGGGDPETMKRLNGVWELIKKKFGK